MRLWISLAAVSGLAVAAMVTSSPVDAATRAGVGTISQARVTPINGSPNACRPFPGTTDRRPPFARPFPQIPPRPCGVR